MGRNDGGSEPGVDWRAVGAKRRGKAGWALSGDGWLIEVGPVVWPGTSFWRVGLCVEDGRSAVIPLVELEHLRFSCEREAFDAAVWLAAVAAV